MDLTGGTHPVELMEKMLEGGLTHQEEGILAEHLKSCAECSGELAFARQSRQVLAADDAAKTPDKESMNRMLERLEKISAQGEEARSRIPALTGAIFASLLFAWWVGNPGKLTRWMATKPATSLSDASIAGLAHAELREALRSLDIPASSAGYIRSPLLAVRLADFENPGEFAGISIVGGGRFYSVDGDAKSGKKSFRVEPSGSPRDGNGMEVRFPVPPMSVGVIPMAVSVWVKSAGIASISLAVRMPEGAIREGSVIREVQPGKWLWVFLPLPALNTYERGRMADLGIRVLGGSPVSFDLVEIWCGGGGGG